MKSVKSGSTLERQAKVFSLYGDPTRLKILQLLGKQQSTKVSDIAAEVNMSIACISHHLQLLKDNELVTANREGNSIYYSLNGDPLVNQLKRFIK